MDVTLKSTAAHSRAFLRPERSANLPVIADPTTQPNRSELKAQPRLRSLRPKWDLRNGPAPVMMAMSKPKRTPPRAAALTA